MLHVEEGEELSRNDHFIVVEDPSGAYWEGALVDAPKARSLAGSGVLLLPADPRMFTVGIGGFFKRAWGAGYPLDGQPGSGAPCIHCPMTLYVSQHLRRVYWMAKVRATKDVPLQGYLRLCADSSSPSNTGGTLAAVENLAVDLAKLDPEQEEWIVQGSALINLPANGFQGFGLYGAAPGVRVVWSAISQSA